FTAWIFSFEENLAIKNAPPIVRLCLTIGVHFILKFRKGGFFIMKIKMYINSDFSYLHRMILVVSFIVTVICNGKI
ncbi:hypothetical protein P4H81_32210, partial [Bacillus cereus]|nr:hypothetical protein [Bacillus cereus]